MSCLFAIPYFTLVTAYTMNTVIKWMLQTTPPWDAAVAPCSWVGVVVVWQRVKLAATRAALTAYTTASWRGSYAGRTAPTRPVRCGCEAWMARMREAVSLLFAGDCNWRGTHGGKTGLTPSAGTGSQPHEQGKSRRRARAGARAKRRGAGGVDGAHTRATHTHAATTPSRFGDVVR